MAILDSLMVGHLIGVLLLDIKLFFSIGQFSIGQLTLLFLLLLPAHMIFRIGFKMIEMNRQIYVSSLSDFVSLHINPSPRWWLSRSL